MTKAEEVINRIKNPKLKELAQSYVDEGVLDEDFNFVGDEDLLGDFMLLATIIPKPVENGWMNK